MHHLPEEFKLEVTPYRLDSLPIEENRSAVDAVDV